MRRDAGAGFWHKACCADGAIAAIDVDVARPVGLGRFVPTTRPIGAPLSASAWLSADHRACAR